MILDELHALAPTKRGDLLALDLARLEALAPGHRRIGLSATVARPSELRAYLVPQPGDGTTRLADLVVAEGGARPEIRILETEQPLPWAGHTTRYAVAEIYAAIKAHKLSLVFVNTRSQAELMFQELWRVNDDGLAIALHHGSLDAARRRKVEAAMAAGTLQGGGVHLHARPRRRLGRRRSRHQCRRAEGGEPADPARRARQPSPGRALARLPGAVQPLRGAGVPGGARRRGRRRPRRRAASHRRARRAGPACPRAPPAARPVPTRHAVPRGPLRVPLCRSDARAVRPHRRVRRHRRLRAQGLRALRQAAGPPATAACACRTRASPSSTA